MGASPCLLLGHRMPACPESFCKGVELLLKYYMSQGWEGGKAFPRGQEPTTGAPQRTSSAALPSAVSSQAGAVGGGRGPSISRAAGEGCGPGPGRAGSLRGGSHAAVEEETQQHKGPGTEDHPMTRGPALTVEALGWPEAEALGCWDRDAGPSPGTSQLERWDRGRDKDEKMERGCRAEEAECTPAPGPRMSGAHPGIRCQRPCSYAGGRGWVLEKIGWGGQGCTRLPPQPQGHFLHVDDAFQSPPCICPLPTPGTSPLPRSSWECQSARCRNLGEHAAGRPAPADPARPTRPSACLVGDSWLWAGL